MDINRIIHPVKNFAELDDSDVAAFLRDRAFKLDHLNLEFKSAFPVNGDKYGIQEICRHIVGFSNEQGGLLVYGVSDSIGNPEVLFPEFVVGLTDLPNVEDLSLRIADRIRPSISQLSIRLFVVEGRTVAIIKVPDEDNKPYCYYDPITGGVWYFRKTANGITELAPDQIKSLYMTSLIRQVTGALRAGGIPGADSDEKAKGRRKKLEAHQKLIKPKLDNIKDFGFVGVYSIPERPVEISYDSLLETLQKYRFAFPSPFPEEIAYAREPDYSQDCISFGYFPRAARLSTFRITLYTDGLVALDSEANPIREGGKTLHPFWLSYELQRHLQLTRALLESRGTERVRLILEMENIEEFSLGVSRGAAASFNDLTLWPYSGAHRPVEKDVNLADISRWDGPDRNIVMPVVKDTMAEVYHIFGSRKTTHRLWDEKGYLTYVKGVEGTR
jgi:hypothetical protein